MHCERVFNKVHLHRHNQKPLVILGSVLSRSLLLSQVNTNVSFSLAMDLFARTSTRQSICISVVKESVFSKDHCEPRMYQSRVPMDLAFQAWWCFKEGLSWFKYQGACENRLSFEKTFTDRWFFKEMTATNFLLASWPQLQFLLEKKLDPETLAWYLWCKITQNHKTTFNSKPLNP